MKKILGNGKYLFVKFPKDVTVIKDIDAWVDELKQFKEKGKPFGGRVVNFKGDKTTLEKLFGTEDMSPSQMNKKIWDYSA